MPSPLTDAIISSITSNLGPQAKMEADLVKSYLEEKEQTLLITKSQTIVSIGALLKKATDEGQDQSVIDCYQKLMAQAVRV